MSSQESDKAHQDLVTEYGEPYRTKRTGDGTVIAGLNERYWAALYALEKDVVYEPDLKTFWIYVPDRGLFTQITEENLREKLGTRIFQEAEDQDLPELRDFATLNRLDSIVRALKGVSENQGFFDNKPAAIHLANGMVVERNGELAFTMEFETMYRSRNQSPFTFQKGVGCPRFMKELMEPMLPVPSDRILLQKWVGMVLSGENRAQRILLLDGTPGRGKGVLLRVLIGLVGRENVTELRTEFIGDRFELNRCIGKTLLQASDVPGDFLMKKWASKLKSLVGGDYLDTEAKGSNTAHGIKGTFNVMIVSNTRLRCRLDGDSGAWRRRLMILRTEAPPVDKKIPNFERVLLDEEGDGILQWALEGYALALADFKSCGDLILSEGQEMRVDMLLAESMALEIFIGKMIEKSPGEAVTSDEILSAFGDFCADKGWQMPAISSVTRQVPDLMLRLHQTSCAHNIKGPEGTRRGYRGVRIRNGE